MPPSQTPADFSPPSVLIGRDHDLAALDPIVQQQRLVTLWGPGGCGKTRLALEVAQIAADSFADGARLVACGDLRDADLLVLHVARTLGLRIPDERMSLDALMEWLPARHLLLILDNCEHVLAACANLVLALLGTCPRLHVLLTSRELLSLPAEQAYPVQPLTLPPAERFPSGEGVPDVTELATYSAIQLFVQRAKMAQPEFMLTPENASQIVKICRLLDGLPLTIELAAARVRMLALEQLADRLTRDCAILGAANRLAPARQRTLQDTIRWSYLLLTPREELLFCRLALVTGSFDLSLVEALGEGWADSSEDTVEVLARLIDKSLISVVSLEGTARYRLLDTTRHFAREQVEHLGEMETTYQLYAGWVRQMTEQAEAELQGLQQDVWLDRLEGEFEHIRSVIRWFLRERKAAEVVRVSAALVTFFEHRGHVREATQWLEAARAHAEALEPALDAQALFALGVLHTRLARAAQAKGYLARAEHYLAQAQECYTQLDSQVGVASTLCQRGRVLYSKGDYLAAKACAETGLATVPREALNLQADLLDALALAQCKLGEHQQAIGLYRKSLTLRRQGADVSGLALTLVFLGRLLNAQGLHCEAKRYLRESLKHFAGIQARDEYLLALINLYDVALALKDPALTQDYLTIALSSPWPECDMCLLTQLFARLARMALLQDHPSRAAKLFSISAALTHTQSDHLPDRVWKQLQQAQDASACLASYIAAWRDGQRMRLDEAFAFAIHDSEPANSEPANRVLETITEAVEAPTTTLRSAVRPALVTAVAPLRIEAFGGGNVSRDGGTASVAWHYSMARELLFYLVDARQRTKEQICLALWPDADTEQASTHMRVTFYQLRKTLRDAAWVPHTPAGYTFNRSLPYWYDVEQFQDLIAEARSVQETQGPLDAREADKSIVGLLAKACALYRGSYLADFPPHEWILHRQTELQRNYIDALSWLGEVTERQGDTPQALDCYQRVTACDPYDEQAHAAILRCYVQLGQRSQALRYYRDLQHFLRDELGVTPDPHITAFVRTLMSQASAAS